jgi:1-acyl-sn-glycerol-3-phosphate acyltransferase
VTLVYLVIRQLFKWVFQTIYRWQIEGRENIPQEGACILCANHISWWDPPLVGCLTHRVVRFMAKEELFAMPVVGRIMPKLNAFPVKRDSADRRAIKTALDTLKNGGILGIFPEGTRSQTDELLPPQPGVGLIALKSGAPVIPVAIIGPYRMLRPIRIRIGAPLYFPEYYGVKTRAEDLEEVSGRMMAEIDRLRRESKTR